MNRLGLYKYIFMITCGTFIYAFGLDYFVIPNHLMEGGVTGLSLLLHYALNIPVSVSTIVLNIPLFIIGWRALGKQDMALTGFGTLSLSVCLWIIEKLIQQGWIVPFKSQNDTFLIVLYAGITLGAGLGIVFRFGGTTGGADIIARLLSKKKGWSMGQVILFFDTIVIGSSLLYLPKENVLYTLVVVFVASKTIDFITKGAYAAKAFTIVTRNPEALTHQISDQLEHSVTLFLAKGGYSKEAKEVIYCIVYRHEIIRLQELVRSIDPDAFIVIHDVQEVLGEGFKTE